jgi:hypothetical protein
MQSYYKSIKFSTTPEDIMKIKNDLMSTLKKAGDLQIASLYDDERTFYLKTTNNIVLHNFLHTYGFEEIYGSVPDLKKKNLIVGV